MRLLVFYLAMRDGVACAPSARRLAFEPVNSLGISLRSLVFMWLKSLGIKKRPSNENLLVELPSSGTEVCGMESLALLALGDSLSNR